MVAMMKRTGVPPKPLDERIKASVKVDPETGCWVWQKFLQYGYGTMQTGSHTTFDRKIERAHRVSYRVFVGPIPADLHIDHLCSNRACVNPEHLEPVTPGTNARRRAARQMGKTWCAARAHIETPYTVHMRKGKRECRICTGMGIADSPLPEWAM